MLLSARMLNAVASVNSFEYAEVASWTQGDTLDLYFQLIDSTLDPSVRGFSPSGRRYCPASGASLSVQINSLDSTKAYTKVATQPFSGDGSIWKISISATDKIVGNRDLILVLTESGVVKNGRVKDAIGVNSLTETA